MLNTSELDKIVTKDTFTVHVVIFIDFHQSSMQNFGAAIVSLLNAKSLNVANFGVWERTTPMDKAVTNSAKNIYCKKQAF